jgi:eukaryotic-like serine/threonine-protein kinase
MSKKKSKLEENFNNTVDGFADLFGENDTVNPVNSLEELHLSSLPRDKYTIIGNVDEGGMKKVLEIEDSDTTRTLAMAVMKENNSGNSREVQRFIYEARITAILQHPNIVPVHDIGVNSQGQPYFTMKLISGENLMTILKKLDKGNSNYSRTHGLPELLTVFLKTCDAIAYAHSKDILHLDLKPDNIQVSDYGEVLVVDWGLAKILHNSFETNYDFEDIMDSVDMTQNGFIKGTPGYMAPEQAMGKNHEKTKLTDIYSLGAILYSILTLKKPYDYGDLKIICEMTAKGALIHPRQRAPERQIPQALEAICLKAMAVQPEKRYHKIDDLIADINAYTSGFLTTAEDATFAIKLKLLIKRHKAIAALIMTGFIVSIFFMNTIFETLKDLKTEQQSRLQISRLAAPRILNEAQQHIDKLEYKKALKLASLSAELDPNFKQAWFIKGKLQLGYQQFNLARYSFAQTDNPSAPEYIRIINNFGQNFSTMTEDEVLDFLRQVIHLNDNDHLPVQLFSYLNDLDRPITQKISLVGKALEVLNPSKQKFTFECFFYEDDKLKLILNESFNIKNIKPLVGLPITNIEIKDTSIHDIKILQTLPLESADLSYAPIKEIESLRHSNIRHLNIRGTRINQLHHLETMNKLQRIEVDQDTSTILEVLMSLSNASQITINNSSISSLKHQHRGRLLEMKEN